MSVNNNQKNNDLILPNKKLDISNSVSALIIIIPTSEICFFMQFNLLICNFKKKVCFRNKSSYLFNSYIVLSNCCIFKLNQLLRKIF